ncbi:methyl-accepting chemotaxis protein [Paenibacillus sp.]|uniref:methyl-accepting chemotaxis protein n=1 Tax=Paenibacillus sp. TaxID=58172 RepID=UPI002D5B92FD|nr:methyl-accepting chemotaxis protein [Paenibacillus sp.]HZG84174.1 methyl-accepting chemotaxis protein [Paenibacillus sp.]
MGWFYNLKISAKLVSAFILIAMVAGAVGVVGIINIRDIDHRDTELFEDNTIAIRDMALWQEKYNSARIVLRDVILSTDPQLQQEKRTRATVLLDEMQGHMADLKGGLTHADVIAELNRLEAAEREYAAIMEKMMQLALTDRREEAIRLLHQESADEVDRVNQISDTLFSMITEDAQEKVLDNTAIANQATVVMIAIVAVAMALAAGLGLWIARIISNPVRTLVDASRKLADGDMNVEVEVRSKDELGALAQSFTTMAHSMNAVLQNIANASEQVASGSRQVSEASQTLSQGSTEQASSIQQLTASIEQIASQTKRNAENAEEANRLALSAHADAELGNDRMKEMLAAMEQINDSSGNISKIIKVIDEIAFQTNILALNAAVEAARAGQHGKGFAVVAEEVRNLAARSANAAKETTALIEGSIKKVEVGTKIATETAQALDQIVDGVNKAASLVGSIAVSSNEQAIGISQVNQGIAQVSEVIQANSATSEECAAASEQLSGQSDQLKQMVGQFRLKRGAGESPRGFVRKPGTAAAAKAVLEAGQLEAAAAAAGKTKIVLDEDDFGKYE